MIECIAGLGPLLLAGVAAVLAGGCRDDDAKVLHETPADRLGSAPPGTGLRAGERAPDSDLVAVTGERFRLSSAWATRPAFLVFYRGGWCPFCNLQLHQLAEALPEFERRGVGIVAISVDLPGAEARTQAKQGVPFPMLSDPRLVAHRAFNVIHVADDAQVQRLASMAIELEAYAGQTHHSFAISSIFLVDTAGVIRFAHVDDDYETRPSPRQLLEIADRAFPGPTR